MIQEAWVIGLHLLSLHSPNCHDTRWSCEPYNNVNAGIYARAPSGLTFGAYRNSYGRPSAYAGWTFETDSKRFALSVAVASGYPARPINPLVVPSVRFDLAGQWSLRLSGGPRIDSKGATVVHASIERPL